MEIRNVTQLRTLPTALLLGSAFAFSGCDSGGGGGSDETQALPAYAHVVMLGGDTSDPSASNSSHGFSAPAANLEAAELDLHMEGDANFEVSFVAAPSATQPERDGLGPVFNNTSCNSCHQRDGRGTPPAYTETFTALGANESLFLRISVEDDTTPVCESQADPAYANGWCAPQAVPGFGDQLFHRGVAALRPAGDGSPTYRGLADVYYRYTEETVTYADGTTVTLRRPVFEIASPYDAPDETSQTASPTSALLQPQVHYGARIGQPVFGLGLLEAIPEADILALADPDDSDGDGISGRPNFVYDRVKDLAGDPDPVSLGRFGWKANTPSVEVQSLGALVGDIGITNPLFPQESIAGTPLHDAYLADTGGTDSGVDPDGSPEAPDGFAESVVFYARTLHVPTRRNVEDPQVLNGARLFSSAGCVACHHPSFTTGDHVIPALAHQVIYPFSDMLLHDMGEGLADGRRDFLADGREWKTRPLWGIGLTKTVNPAAGFLHDGRARSLEEAILWHGGEAEAARERFRTLSADDRAALIAFLSSL